MVQRIQSLYLLGVALIGGFGLFFNLGSCPHGSITSFKLTCENACPLYAKYTHYEYAALAIVISVLALVNIFMFSKRKLQRNIGILLILLAIGNLSMLLYIFPGDEDFSMSFAAFIPTIQIILLLLAIRAIKKDEDLIRSTDRLR